MKFTMNDRNKVGLIADEGLVKGFMMTGLILEKKAKNFHTVDMKTPEEELEEIFEILMNREDIAIIFVADFVAQKIKPLMDKFKEVVPTVMIIPTKEGNFNDENEK